MNNRMGVKFSKIEIEQEKQKDEQNKSGSDYKDLMKTIDWNERRYQEQAKATMKQNQILA